ncbi:hypothetical protein PM082_009490 [Marasmius tenuissimus]|nr:hypothetical protein PM082_009490 [Marasmius tenuissimus]
MNLSKPLTRQTRPIQSLLHGLHYGRQICAKRQPSGTLLRTSSGWASTSDVLQSLQRNSILLRRLAALYQYSFESVAWFPWTRFSLPVEATSELLGHEDGVIFEDSRTRWREPGAVHGVVQHLAKFNSLTS